MTPTDNTPGEPTVRSADYPQPLVSILIPAHNAGPWIADTIRSALAQTWQRKEIIVVDDGSSDDTLQRAREFESAGVQVIHHDKEGACAARNRAFSSCRGDYIQWLDADDLLTPDKIERQLAARRESDTRFTLLASGWGRFIARPSKVSYTPSVLWSDLSPVEHMTRKFEEGVFLFTASWLVSRELTEVAGPWDTRLLLDQDGEYFCRVILASDRIRFAPEGRALYRVRGTDRVSYLGRSDAKRNSDFLSRQLTIRYLMSADDSARVRAACIRHLQRGLLRYYPERPDLVAKAQELAGTLGGRLICPPAQGKYARLQRLVGWRRFRTAKHAVATLRAHIEMSWDRSMYHLENRVRAFSIH